MKNITTLALLSFSLCLATVGCAADSDDTSAREEDDRVLVAPKTDSVDPAAYCGTECVWVNTQKYCRKMVRGSDGVCY